MTPTNPSMTELSRRIEKLEAARADDRVDRAVQGADIQILKGDMAQVKGDIRWVRDRIQWIVASAAIGAAMLTGVTQFILHKLIP